MEKSRWLDGNPSVTFEEKEGGGGGERMRERTVARAVFG